MKKNIECTLVLIKPDGVEKGVHKDVFARYRRAFLHVIYCSDALIATGEQLYEHYEGIGQLLTRKGEEIFNETVQYMMSGPILKAIIVGEDAVQKVRELNGATKPWEAKKGIQRVRSAMSSTLLRTLRKQKRKSRSGSQKRNSKSTFQISIRSIILISLFLKKAQ